MKTTGVVSGVFWGIVYVFIYLIAYAVGYKAFTSSILSWSLFFTGLAVLIFFGLRKRKENDGFLSFGESFAFMVVTIIIGFIIVTGFNLLLFYVIDPTFMDNMKEIAINKAIEDGENRGASEHQIDAGVSVVEFLFSGKGQLLITGFWILIWTIIGFIISLVIKKNKPEFAA